MNKHRARGLRKSPTEAERILWREIRLRQIDGHKFRRQQPLGDYIVDFVCFEKRLIIEVDGGQHSESEHDVERDAWLRSQGFSVLRFWNNEISRNIESVKEVIFRKLKGDPPHLNPPPQGGRS